MVGIMIPLTSEKVQGVLDDATYTATLCMARDGKHYFYTAIAVDGAELDVPNKRWSSRRAALAALAEIASTNRKPGAPSRAADREDAAVALLREAIGEFEAPPKSANDVDPAGQPHDGTVEEHAGKHSANGD